MKLYHFTMLFSILFMVLGGLLCGQYRYKYKLELEKTRLDRCVDSAIDAAAGHLAVYSGGKLKVDKEGALEAFLHNMYAGMGILDNIPAQQQCVSHIPFLVIVDGEGYWLWHMAWDLDKEAAGYIHYWDEKEYFYNIEGGQEGEGIRSAAIERALEEAVREYNIFSGQAGLEYRFILPELDNCLWLRGIEEPGILVFVQGMPLLFGKQVYSRFSFAGAVIHKRQEENRLPM